MIQGESMKRREWSPLFTFLSPRRDLREATKAADWDAMRLLLRRMPAKQINSNAPKGEGDPAEDGNTALHFAVSINWEKGFKKLLRYGASMDVINAGSITPLHMALEAGKLKLSDVRTPAAPDLCPSLLLL
jgi:hypothetical protein